MTVVVKVTRGRDMAGAVRYLATDKEAVKRVNPHVVTGLGRDGEPLTPEAVRELADELDAPRVLSGTEIREGHVWACSLSIDDNRTLGDEQWREIADEFMRRMDFGNVRWVAVRHGLNGAGCDHAHLLVNLVREDGRAADEWGYLRRASQAANAIEHKFGLSVNESRELGVGTRGVSRPALERAATLGREPETHYLERVVRACAIEARDEREFVQRVRDHGVKVKPRMAKGSTTEVAGYSYSVNGSVPYGGHRLARDLSLPRLRERWDAPQLRGTGLDVEAQQAAGRLAAWSLRSERTPGPIAREAHELGRFAQTRVSGGLTLTAATAAALRERVRAANREAELQRDQDEREQERHRTPGRDRERGIGI